MTEEIKEQNEELNEEQELTMEDLFAEQEKLLGKLNKKEIVQVTVVQIGQDSILVDTGDKKEGYIAKTDFDGKDLPEVGSKVSAVLVKKGGDERGAVLSHKKALEELGWDVCKKAYETKERVRGAVTQCVKGGYIVEVFGVGAFMPLSLSELHSAYKHYLPVGAKVKCVIVEMGKDKSKLIVSRKQVLEEDENVRRDSVYKDIKEGDVLRVVISKPEKEKVYVRFHGIEGFVRLENVAWQEPEKAIETYKRGMRVKAKLLKIDRERNLLEFGFKQTALNPADALKRKYPYKSTVKAKIEKISDEDGVEVSFGKDGAQKGYVSPFEMGRDFTGDVGDTVTLMVIGVNPDNMVINLSAKKYDMAQSKKVVAQYMKQAPRPTLGQLLQDSLNESEEK